MSHVPKHNTLEKANKRSTNFTFFSWAKSTSQRNKTIQVRWGCLKKKNYPSRKKASPVLLPHSVLLTFFSFQGEKGTTVACFQFLKVSVEMQLPLSLTTETLLPGWNYQTKLVKNPQHKHERENTQCCTVVQFILKCIIILSDWCKEAYH